MKLTQIMCRGAGNIFKGTECEHYDGSQNRCNLRSEGHNSDIYQKGRCVFAMTDFVRRQLAGQFHVDVDVDQQKMIEGLRGMTWQRSYGLTNWLYFLRNTARRMAINILAKQRVLPGRKNCGSCGAMTLSKPYKCQLSGEIRKRRDVPCEHYHFLPITLVSESDESSTDADNGNEQRFYKSSVEKSEEAQRYTTGKITVTELRAELQKRVETAKVGSRKRAKFVRQYDVFVNLHALLAQVDTYADAVKILSERLAMTRKTIGRDIDEIREFLNRSFRTY